MIHVSLCPINLHFYITEGISYTDKENQNQNQKKNSIDFLIKHCLMECSMLLYIFWT